ncbi:MAG: transcription termination/antitermination protein NusG [Prevotellaceae bacterium]|nr:transcription termination/antitermination protein NusG [Prevotellaceae bacterium]
MKWYVIRAISGKENKVREYIEAEMKNPDFAQYVSQVLIPTEKVYQVRNGRKVTKERSSMPGYVLIEANLIGEIPHILRNTPNVIGFLQEKNNRPIPIRPSEMNRILGTMDERQAMDEEILTPYYVGDSIRVVFGPFTGFSGVIEDVNPDKRKLKVMVMIFGRKSPLELSFTQVEKE